jgi:GT2 family glycosyltransferase
MLASLEAQSCRPNQVVIVDGSNRSVKDVANRFRNLDIKYLRCLPPSVAKQRNVGISVVEPDITLIGFLDDDIVLETDAVEKMLDFWEGDSQNIGGAALNMVNHPQLYARRLKSTRLTERLGLYSLERGIVLPSGFHTMIGYVPKTTFTQWLPSGAVVWRRKVFNEYQFDEWFSDYSYLEDLDFSYRVSRQYALAVVANAKYLHYPSPPGRVNPYIFGKKEVFNRLHFVKKCRELSLCRSYVALILRTLLSMSSALREPKGGHLRRVFGNVIGLVCSLPKYL